MFGFPRLKHLAGAHPGDGLIEVLLAELASFSADPTKVDDDVTLLTVERTGETGDSRVIDARIRIVDDFTVPSAAGNERIAMQRVGGAGRGAGRGVPAGRATQDRRRRSHHERHGAREPVPRRGSRRGEGARFARAR